MNMRTPFLEFLVIFFSKAENQRSLYWLWPQVKVVIVRGSFCSSSQQMDRPARKDWKLSYASSTKTMRNTSCVFLSFPSFSLMLWRSTCHKLELVQRRDNFESPRAFWGW
jgi:hypothetical protein